MALKLSNSGHDERGKYNSGTAGDQTGTEWEIRSWYNRPWACVLRHPTTEVRTKIAELAWKAAKNDKIGYDQYQRTTYWTQLEKAKYNPSAITVACEADCSAGVCANVKAVGYLLGIDKLKKISITSTHYMREVFKNAGFTVLTASKYLNGTTNLKEGDILLYDSVHTCTVVDDASNYAKASTTAVTTEKSVETIAKEVIDGKWGIGDDRKKKLTAAGYNYSTVQEKVNELLSGKKSVETIAKEVIDGKWGNGDTRKKKIVAAGYDYSAVQKKVNELLK